MKVFCKTYKLLFFWTTSGKVLAGCPKQVSVAFKLLSTSPWELLKNFLLKSFCFFCGLFFRSFPVIEQEWFGRPVKTAFFVSTKSFWKKNCFGKQLKFFIIFRHSAGRFRLLFEFFDGDVGAAFYVSKITFYRRLVFFQFFFSLLDTERFFWPILAKKLSELSKVNSQFQWKLSGESFLQNLQTVIFLNNERKGFGWLSETSQRGFQTAFYLSLGTFWKKFFIEKFLHLLWTFFRIISSNWARKIFTGLSKLHSLYLTNHFEEKTVLENKRNFSSFLDSEQEVFGFLSSFSTGMLELHFTCPKQHFNEKQFSF